MNKTIKQSGNLTLTFEDQFYQNLGRAFVILQNTFYNYEVKVFSDANDKILLRNLPWGIFSIHVTHDDFAFPKQVIELASQELELTLFIDTEGPIISAGNYAY